MVVFGTTLAIAVLAIIVVGGVLLLRSRSSTQNGKKSADDFRSARREVTLENVEPGDAIIFWDDSDSLIETVLECQEHVGERATQWRWVFLSDGRLIEVSGTRRKMYSPPEVFYQGSAPFAELTAEVDQGGALKTFEDRVRDGSVASQPVAFTYDGTRYAIRSTGTFAANVKGKPLQTDVWADLSANESDNVYFKMQSSSGEEALGTWTTHIAFSTGKSLADSDIKGIYGK
ncbi:MAG: hypothetical protein M1343_10830 [Chloroflexi bacterium]|nr:hypothetical protein [Chloroflexota bacterium]